MIRYCDITASWVVAPSTVAKKNWQGYFKVQFWKWKKMLTLSSTKRNSLCVWRVQVLDCTVTLWYVPRGLNHMETTVLVPRHTLRRLQYTGWQGPDLRGPSFSLCCLFVIYDRSFLDLRSLPQRVCWVTGSSGSQGVTLQTVRPPGNLLRMRILGPHFRPPTPRLRWRSPAVCVLRSWLVCTCPLVPFMRDTEPLPWLLPFSHLALAPSSCFINSSIHSLWAISQH